MHRLTPQRFAVLVLAAVVLTWAITTALTPTRRTPPIQSDALGPESGQTVQDYLDRAAVTVDAAQSADGDNHAASGDNHAASGENHWALVSFTAALTPQDADGILAGAGIPRVSEVLINVPLDAVAMPVLSQAVPLPPQGEASYTAALRRAAEQAVTNNGDAGGRAGEARAYTAGAIAAGKGSIIGLVVRSSIAALQAAQASGQVRAIEVLPADAVWGRFAVRPLLPGYREQVAPLPDDGTIPAPPQPPATPGGP